MKRYLVRPFMPLNIILQAQVAFWTFVAITIVIGQMGFLFAFLAAIKNPNMTVRGILSDNLVAGNFYTFSISLIASSLTPFLLEYIDKKDIRFRHIKLITSVCVCSVLLLPMAFLFGQVIGPTQSNAIKIPIDKTQCVFYVVSMLASVYLFCLSYLHLDSETYAELEQEGLITLRRKIPSKTQDSKGNAL
jgi:hypothetical protein